MDMTTVSAAMTSIKAATDIAKYLIESGVSLESADNKLKLADLITSLAEARTALVEAQEVLAEKDRRIKELEESLVIKGDIILYGDAYYFKDANGKPTGKAYCLHCWEKDHKLFTLIDRRSEGCICTVCKNKYDHHRARFQTPATLSDPPQNH